MHRSSSGRGGGDVVIGRGNFHWAFFRNFTFKYAVFVDDGFKLMTVLVLTPCGLNSFFSG